MLMKIFDAFRIAAASTIMVSAVVVVVIGSLAYGYNQHGWMGVGGALACLYFIFVFFQTLIKEL